MAFTKLKSFILSAMLLAAPATSYAQEPVSEPSSNEVAASNAPPTERRRARPPAAPTPAETLAAANAVLTTTGAACQATAAIELGLTVTAQEKAYEVSCRDAPGLLVIASTPPKAISCLELAGQALTTRELDPAAEVGQQCTLPENLNAVPFVTAWAQQAGVNCSIDQASAIGRAPGAGLIYEVGCADADGFWLTEEGGAWKATPCWDIVLDDQKCRFTTADEGRAGWRLAAAATEASACDVQQARRVGRDAQGLTVYELKCAQGDGYFVRMGSDWTAKRAATCASSANVAGGCRLTVAAAPSPTGGRI